jgi:hypothetical protein
VLSAQKPVLQSELSPVDDQTGSRRGRAARAEGPGSG